MRILDFKIAFYAYLVCPSADAILPLQNADRSSQPPCQSSAATIYSPKKIEFRIKLSYSLTDIQKSIKSLRKFTKELYNSLITQNEIFEKINKTGMSLLTIYACKNNAVLMNEIYADFTKYFTFPIRDGQHDVNLTSDKKMLSAVSEIIFNFRKMNINIIRTLILNFRNNRDLKHISLRYLTLYKDLDKLGYFVYSIMGFIKTDLINDELKVSSSES